MTVVGNIIADVKKMRANIILNKTLNYTGIRTRMGFNDNTKKFHIGEMGGSWTFVKKNGDWDIVFVNSGSAQQGRHGLQMMHLPNIKDNINRKQRPVQHPWHTHPHSATGRGFWPSLEDLYSILSLSHRQFDLIITLHGIWVLSRTRPRNQNQIVSRNNFNKAFKNAYERINVYFFGDGKVPGKDNELLRLKLTKNRNYGAALDHMIKHDIKAMDTEFSNKFGIRIKFFKYKKDVIEYLKDKIPVQNNQS
jgi:hypothetical protein